jgi:hypothetical protein
MSVRLPGSGTEEIRVESGHIGDGFPIRTECVCVCVFKWGRVQRGDTL